jgi:hypothetical protein
MAASNTAIPTTPGQWTLISANNASVAFQWRDENGYGRWYIGQSAPETSTLDYTTLRPRQTVSLNDLSVGDKIWVMPDSGDAELVVEVITP